MAKSLTNTIDRAIVTGGAGFVGSNLAHQSAKLDGAARTALVEWIEKIEFVVFQLPRPTLTILIDMSSQMSRELVSRKAARDYTEQEADLQESDLPYLERVRRCYLALAHEAGSLRTIDDVGEEIRRLVCENLGQV